MRSASSASIMRPVRIMSIALDLPMSRGSRCVAPEPGKTPMGDLGLTKPGRFGG